MQGGQQQQLLFQQFNSFVDFTFWNTLTKLKLDEFRLSEESVDLSGEYTTKGAQSSYLRIASESFSKSSLDGNCHGSLLNVNTIESFKTLDRKAIVSKTVERFLNDVASGAAERDPRLLTRFSLITFADLKQYKFLYWFCFPVVSAQKAFLKEPSQQLSSVFSADQLSQFASQFSNQIAVLVRVRHDGSILTGPLTAGKAFFENGDLPSVAVLDSGTGDDVAGWNVRGLLFLLSSKWNLSQVRLILIREPHDVLLRKARVVLVELQKTEQTELGSWEKDQKGESKPRLVNLAAQMDPKKLLTTAVDLNLKLMKWRLAPEMKLDEIAQLKCLLLGSGTLGCNIARSLLGWGCRNITFVDSGKVSYSNPVRQSLFSFEDCLDGGKPKALAAADAVKRIFPECNVRGVQLRIPMPGHPIPESDMAKTQAEHQVLAELVDTHDVIFLLTDSREARWLGTVMGAAAGKIVMNAALGFDSYLVMRHGNRSRGDCQLGCYFCSDVVAPSDSLRDRTLDQQCTVTRPGVSMLASALAIELLVSMLHSPLLDSAPADTPSNGNQPNENNPVGLIPHQIRGFMGNYSNLLIVGHAYDRCTACSEPVLKGYKERGFDFVVDACASGSFLEDLTGLTAMKNEQVHWDIDPVSDGDSGASATDDFSMD